eukprot:TRINITY_DN3609_c0_g1_i2.p1 TRINITY_DN3609_c0_g1~~TRINITY_DN3609_c0_g1_i2.p1  ORF type:complete len:568 (-),score=147.00 TRINITY_DN3609_c0_g1_i2:147-1850(-)
MPQAQIAGLRASIRFFFFKQKTAYEIMPSLVGSEMCIRDRVSTQSTWGKVSQTVVGQKLMDTGADTQNKDKLYIEVVEHVSNIYSNVNDAVAKKHEPRYDELTKRFKKVYNETPEYYARCPGRVNLIGEHIDYMGYGVLPFALEQDTVIAFKRTKEPTIVINHILDAKFPKAEVSNDPNQKIDLDTKNRTFVDYFVSGYKAGLADFDLKEPVGLRVLISGNLPVAAGLSSSASFMGAVAVIALVANDLQNKIKKHRIIENLIKYERLLGINCGGMDQSIALLGEKGNAQYIQFDPLRNEQVTLPEGYSFVIAHSLAPSPKILTLGTRYNKRVVECRIALQLMLLKFEVQDKSRFKNLSSFQEFMGYSLEEMVTYVKENIEKKVYKTQDLEQIFGSPLMKVVADIPYADVVINSNSEYYPYERALHVYSEASRVIQFKNICNGGNPDVKKLAELMNDSQKSCRELYDCSCEELDKLTALALANGAIGSRLTGAGWGGCCVSLVANENAEKLIEAVMTQYYLNKDNDLNVDDDLEMLVFNSAPARGACCLDPRYEIWFQACYLCIPSLS